MALGPLVMLLMVVTACHLVTARPPQPTLRPARPHSSRADDEGWQKVQMFPAEANPTFGLPPADPHSFFSSRPSQQQAPQQQQQQQQAQPPQSQLQLHQFGMVSGSRLPLPPSQQASQSNPYTNATHAILLDLRQQLITRAMKFDDHFRSLLSQSKLSLHNMFVATYGMMYEHNTEIFTSMYESLEQYYATGRIELTKSMDSFFQRLYQKIFQVANSNRVFSPNYLECVTEQLTILKPFKDAPDKLIVDIRQTLVAARTFNQALNSAIDIIKSIISLGDPPQCIKLISEKLLRSQLPAKGTTRELPLTGPVGSISGKQQPCQNYCEQVILRCVGRANLEPLADRWKNYILALADLAKKLSVQYNIETTIGPIDVQISEAIMNFQENSHNITRQIYAACGDAKPNNGLQPTLSNVTPLRAPTHNLLGKREAIALRAPSAASSPNSFGYSKPQQASSRRQSQTTALRQADAVHPVMAPTSSDFEHGPPPSRALGSSSASHMPYERQRSGMNGIHGHTPSLYDAYSEDLTAGSPISQFNRKSPVIIGEIRDYLLTTKNFWSVLPNSVCNATLSANSSMSEPRRNSQQNCFHDTLEIYDMNSDIKYGSEIRHQVQRLDAMYTKILDALRGVEIDWSKMSDASGALNVPLDSQQASQNRPATTANQAARPSASSQPVGPGAGPHKPVLVADDDEDPDESTDESSEPLDENGEEESEDSDEYTTPLTDDDDDVDPREDETSDSSEDLSSTTQSTDLTSDSPTSPVDNNIENEDKTQVNLSNDLITIDSSPRKSSAHPGSSSVVIDRMTLLLVSILYCALSVVMQNHFRQVSRVEIGA